MNKRVRTLKRVISRLERAMENIVSEEDTTDFSLAEREFNELVTLKKKVLNKYHKFIEKLKNEGL